MSDPNIFLQAAIKRAEKRLKHLLIMSGTRIMANGDMILELPERDDQADAWLKEIVRRGAIASIREGAAEEGISQENYLLGQSFEHAVEDLCDHVFIEQERELLRNYARREGVTYEHALALSHLEMSPETRAAFLEVERLKQRLGDLI